MASRKSWTDKLHDTKDLPRVGPIEGKMRERWGEGTVVIPSPLEVDGAMRRVRKGELLTINQIRGALAEKHGATMGCPFTTGIFAWIAAHAASEQREAGRKRITPFWRTLKSGGELNPKYPGGTEAQAELLRDEGHEVVAKGKKLVVKDFERRLARLDPSTI